LDPSVRAALHAEDENWWALGRAMLIDCLLDRYQIGDCSQIVDVGCGTGFMVERLGARGEVIGVEHDESSVEFAQARGRRVIHAEGTCLPFSDGSSSLVAALDVLEHVDDELPFLEEMRRITQPGGWLVLSVPAHQWLWSTYDVDAQHFRRYSRSRLLTVVAESGWKPVCITGYNLALLGPAIVARTLSRSLARVGGQGIRASSEMRISGKFSPVGKRIIRLEERVVRRGVNLPSGLSLILLARNDTLPETRFYANRYRRSLE
jgi:SAM-dependent methyltransferase